MILSKEWWALFLYFFTFFEIFVGHNIKFFL
jgi:hypothetical protein